VKRMRPSKNKVGGCIDGIEILFPEGCFFCFPGITGLFRSDEIELDSSGVEVTDDTAPRNVWNGTEECSMLKMFE
jgi:hypothetical protein